MQDTLRATTKKPIPAFEVCRPCQWPWDDPNADRTACETNPLRVAWAKTKAGGDRSNVRKRKSRPVFSAKIGGISQIAKAAGVAVMFIFTAFAMCLVLCQIELTSYKDFKVPCHTWGNLRCCPSQMFSPNSDALISKGFCSQQMLFFCFNSVCDLLMIFLCHTCRCAKTIQVYMHVLFAFVVPFLQGTIRANRPKDSN